MDTFPPPARRLTRCLIVLGFLFTCQGCSHFGTFQRWQPAEIAVDGLSSVTVMEFDGEHGDAVASTLTARLYDGQFYSLVDRSQLSPVSQVSLGPDNQQNAILRAARSANVDAIISGNVVEYRCEDQVLTDTSFSVNQHEGNHGEGMNVGFSNSQTLRREGTVTVSFRLIDTMTGEVRATRQTSHHFEGVHDTRDPASVPLPTKGEVLTNLTNACVDDFTRMLAPHRAECRMKLATAIPFSNGWTAIRQGVKLAERGEWEAAERKWQEALAKNPMSDVATYNLAVAAAAREDYAQAENLARDAIKLKHSDLYVDSLEVLRQQHLQDDACQAQHATRVTQASHRDWR
ncbi:MAG: CsgG/HfaB family protein [Planctomycetaceae bacterium]